MSEYKGVDEVDELLTLMLSSDQITIKEISSRLHMSEAIIFARMERYEQLGYVRRIVEDGPDGCSGMCSGCKGCGSHKLKFKPSVYWVKGKKLDGIINCE